MYRLTDFHYVTESKQDRGSVFLSSSRGTENLKGFGSISCFGSCSEWNMSLPNAVIDGRLGDRWTHKEHFAREVPVSAQRLTLTFHRTTYIKWSIVLPLSDEVPCLRNRAAALQGQNSSVEKWADLSPRTLFCQWFIFRPHHLYKIRFLAGTCLILVVFGANL